MSADESTHTLSPAAEAFASFLARRDRGEDLDLETLCREHPDQEDQLRALHRRWLVLQQAFDEIDGPVGAGAPVSARRMTPRPPGSEGPEGVLEHLRRESPESDRFSVQREIARGGMGAVFDVWDRDLRRNLAMKVLLQDPATRFEPRALSRFLREAQITGQLEHPGITPVHELGIDAGGSVYFTMPLVRGITLLEIIQHVHGDGTWTLPRALEIVVRVCEAVGYAHSRGVIHRDLKPSNVMVGAFGETYVVDWGLAGFFGPEQLESGSVEALPPGRSGRGDEEPQAPGMTLHGDVLGTPTYMSPEQAHGRTDATSPRSDVYSIGAVLYHVLSGSPPYGEAGGSESTAEILREVRAGSPQPLQARVNDLPAELVAITAKAMERDPARRYGSAMDLGQDLRAYLEGRVVRAHESGASAELRKWMRRNRALTLASGLALAFLVVGFAASVTLGLRAKHNENLADEAATRLAGELRAGRIERGRLLARSGNMRDAEELLWREFLRDPEALAAAWALRELYAREPSLASWHGHDGATTSVWWLADASLVTAGLDGRLRRWSARGERMLTEVQGHQGEVHHGALAPGGERLATLGHQDGTLALWSLPDLGLEHRMEVDGHGLYGVDFDPSGARLATTGLDGWIREWSVPDLEPLRAHDASGQGSVYGIRYAPDGQTLAFSTADGHVHLWPAGATAPTRSWPSRSESLLFLDGGRRLAAGGRGRELQIWRLDDATPGEPWSGDNGSIRDLVQLSEGGPLVSSGWYRLDFWDPARAERLHSYSLSYDAFRAKPSPDGRVLAVGCGGGAVTLYETRPQAWAYTLGGHTGSTLIAFHPDGRTAWTGDGEGTVREFDLTRNELVRSFRAHPSPVACLELSRDGSLLATAGEDGSVRVRDLRSETVVFETSGLDATTPRSLDLTPDGKWLGMVLPDCRIRIVEVATGDTLASVVHEGGWNQAFSVAILPQHDRFLTSSQQSDLRIWTLGGELAASIPRDATRRTLEPRGDGLVAVGTWGYDIELVDALSAGIHRTLRGHAGTVWNTAFHPTDPRLLASCADDRTVRLWNLDTEGTLATFDLPASWKWAAASSVAFSPDGRTLAAAGPGDPVLWDLEYYDQHVAGNLRRHLGLWDEPSGDAERDAAREWAARALARPWPRLPLEPAR